MPASEFLNLLPVLFIWAILMYVCFRYADRRIRSHHREAFSEWLRKSRAYERDDRTKKQIQETVREGIREIFDRLYILPFSTPAADAFKPYSAPREPKRKLGTRAFVIRQL
jgi:hypothetical protein